MQIYKMSLIAGFERTSVLLLLLLIAPNKSCRDKHCKNCFWH
ncbi:hypothetical protein yinte0001_30100 [Yersinia intermedia ATCC 29909]|nr:hypothetical protein yinte0001_30100 [Yersinia intermedia ATCC 29909]